MMSAEELAEWRILDANGSFGERRMDRRFAKMTVHVMAAIPFGPKGPFALDTYTLKEDIALSFEAPHPEDRGPTVADFDAAFGKS